MDYSPIHSLISSRILVEKLLLKRNPLDYKAYIETFRESLIDANPHQIEAVVYALEKLENGGCILADEVGLGKTIEAGLVISQFRARRRFNILVIVPTSLAGQWNNELRTLFQVPSRMIDSNVVRKHKKSDTGELFSEPGVYIMGRELASRLAKTRTLSRIEWDLIVVDEAHEVFANIYKRFNPKDGNYNEDSKQNLTAAHLYRLFKRTPLLLLTATPIQNDILELWGLAAYILPENKNYLGRLNHFKDLFLHKGHLVEVKLTELRDRVGNFLVRNLRQNAQAFMDYKFTDRNCQTLNFNMDNEELSLYRDISAYLERDDIYAYANRGMVTIGPDKSAGIRTLLKMSYRRALGSSFSALRNSLQKIAARLDKMRSGIPLDLKNEISTDDSGNDEEDLLAMGIDNGDEGGFEARLSDEDLPGLEAEIAEVESYIRRAQQISETAKDAILVKTLHTLFADPERFYPKAVIFTTYIATQKHLRKVLEENGLTGEVVLFSGSGKRDPQEREEMNQIIAIWEEEVGLNIPAVEKPGGNILERTAIVHYFKTRKKILISTEAGAKGLNLQFCNILINYDLPWNPQRIEQRIGRCHRYGQEKDVMVINCINEDNETEKRVYQILENKFSLFKSVLGAGDAILGGLSNAFHFEKRINDILNNFKTPEEREHWLQQFEEEIDDETRKLRDTKISQARQLLDELDPNVTDKLRNIKRQLPQSFSQYDADLLALLRHYASFRSLPFQQLDRKNEHILLRYDNRAYYIGRRDEEQMRDFTHINLKDSLIADMIDHIKEQTPQSGAAIVFHYNDQPKKPEILKPHAGKYGRWDFYSVNFKGLEEEERLYHILVVQDGDGICHLIEDEINALLALPCSSGHSNNAAVEDADMKERLEEKTDADEAIIREQQQIRIDRKLQNLKAELADMKEYLDKKEAELTARIDELDQKLRNTTDRTEGKRMLEEKAKLDKEARNTRTQKLTFENDFADDFAGQELALQEKRFFDVEPRLVFSLCFEIR